MGDDPGLRLVLPVGRTPLSIVAGYLGLFSIALLPAPFALVVSALALRELNQKPEAHGRGRAVFGLVMGALGSLALLTMALRSL